MLPGALTIVLGALVAKRRERTLPGEILAAAALASAAFLVAVAGGIEWHVAFGAWAAFSAAFAASTVEVRAVAHRKTSRTARATVWAFAIGVAAALTVTRVSLALTHSVLGVALAIAAEAPPPTALRRIGWTIASASTAMAGAMVLALPFG